MKQIVAIVFIGVCLYLTNGQTCRQDCADTNNRCPLLKGFCHRQVTARLCPLTCGTCTPCFGLRPPLSNCEVGTCRDRYSPLMCYYLKTKPFGCLIFRNVCRATCGLCQGCQLPPTEIPCTNDCADTHSSCKYWKSKDFCSTSKGFPHVITVCPLSCARCVLCPTQEPNTALPPTEEEEKSRVLGNFTINAA